MVDDDASVFFLSERTYYILKESIWSSSGAHLDRIGSNWRLRAPDTLREFKNILKNREHLELIWIGLDRIGSNWRLRARDILVEIQIFF